MPDLPDVFITRAIPEAALQLLASALPGLKVAVNPRDANLTPAEIASMAAGAQGLICTLADDISRALIESLPRLRVIATYAVGTNNIDLAAARERGIVVANTPDVLTDATAEVAVGLMLACARRFIEGDVLTRQGSFRGWAPLFHLGFGVYGKTVGIVGAGRIGLRVARTMRHGFDCRVLYTARSAHPEFEAQAQATRVDLNSLLEQSDFVSLHCPLTPQTKHLIDGSRLARMKRSAFLINTARGPVVDESALVEALKAGRIAGAGLDVFEQEPALAPGLAGLGNVTLLPHIGSATVETRQRMGLMCAQAIIDVLGGREPANRVVPG